MENMKEMMGKMEWTEDELARLKLSERRELFKDKLCAVRSQHWILGSRPYYVSLTGRTYEFKEVIKELSKVIGCWCNWDPCDRAWMVTSADAGKMDEYIEKLKQHVPHELLRIFYIKGKSER